MSVERPSDKAPEKTWIIASIAALSLGSCLVGYGSRDPIKELFETPAKQKKNILHFQRPNLEAMEKKVLAAYKNSREDIQKICAQNHPPALKNELLFDVGFWVERAMIENRDVLESRPDLRQEGTKILWDIQNLMEPGLPLPDINQQED